MKKEKHAAGRYRISFLLLFLLLCVLFVWNINSGSVAMSLPDIIKIVFRREGEATAYNIIWQIRLPRVLAAVILGGALSVSGFLLQTFMICFLSRGITVSAMMMVLAAFFGSMISMGFVLVVSRKVRRMSMLVICGVMISYICSAITDFVVTFADDSNIVNLHNWSMGSFSGMTWSNVLVMTVIVFISVITVFFMSKPIGAYQLGEVYAQNLGVNIKAFRAALILLSSILSACVTAFAGPVSFVGIAVPHLVKNVLKTSKPILVIPACFLGGAVFCLFCDLIARTLFAPTELSISSVTALFGAPVVILIMIRRQKER